MNTMSGNILIIDDTPANLDVLTQFLAQRGHKVRPAISGEAGLHVAVRTQPDVILLDVQMPEMDGFEVCTRLKADPATQSIPVIFLSARDGLEDKVHAFDVGGVDYITKPFQVMEVLARVESQLRIQWQRRRIEALSAFKDDLIGIVSHDLKNPLNIILSSVEMMLFHMENDEPIDPRMLTFIQRAGFSMQSLIHDLLDTARYEQGIPLHTAPTSLQEVADEQIMSFAMAAQGKPIALEKVFAPDPIVVRIDARRFAQVIANLLSNAIKYSSPNTTITVRVWHEGAEAVLDVIDQGFGIPEHDLPHIFEKFYRVNTVRHMKAEGTGLGLPIARMLVEQHGGRLLAESTENVGSTFTIRLPLA
jgi:signal transduction histidine kinase